jgi:hypothetical protein
MRFRDILPEDLPISLPVEKLIFCSAKLAALHGFLLRALPLMKSYSDFVIRAAAWLNLGAAVTRQFDIDLIYDEGPESSFSGPVWAQLEELIVDGSAISMATLAESLVPVIGSKEFARLFFKTPYKGKGLNEEKKQKMLNSLNVLRKTGIRPKDIIISKASIGTSRNLKTIIELEQEIERIV